MLEYTYDDAAAMLAHNLQQAQTTLATVREDLDFLREQITISEVSIGHGARPEIYRFPPEHHVLFFLDLMLLPAVVACAWHSCDLVIARVFNWSAANAPSWLSLFPCPSPGLSSSSSSVPPSPFFLLPLLLCRAACFALTHSPGPTHPSLPPPFPTHALPAHPVTRIPCAPCPHVRTRRDVKQRREQRARAAAVGGEAKEGAEKGREADQEEADEESAPKSLKSGRVEWEGGGRMGCSDDGGEGSTN